MKRVLFFGLAAAWGLLAAVGLTHFTVAPEPVHAQAQNFCDKTISISVASGQTQTIASAVAGTTVYVCGFVLTADTIATTAQFKSGSTNLSGAMRFCDECRVSWGSGDAIVFQSPGDGNLTITTATGAVTGMVRIGQN